MHPEYLRCGEKCNKYDVAVLTTKKTVIMSEVETRTYVVHIEPWNKPEHTKWCRGVHCTYYRKCVLLGKLCPYVKRLVQSLI